MSLIPCPHPSLDGEQHGDEVLWRCGVCWGLFRPPHGPGAAAVSAHARPYPATVSVSPVSRTVPVRSTLWVNVGTREEPEWMSRAEADELLFRLREVESGGVQWVPLEAALLEIGWVDMEP